MKKVILSLLVLLPFSALGQSQWKTINYNNVSVQIPSDWGSKNSANQFSDSSLTEYQISCWSKDKTMTFVVQWAAVEIESDLYIESLIETQKERFPIFKNFIFDKIVDTNFINIKAKKCHYSSSINNVEYEGEYIAFTKNNISYLVMIFGDNQFYYSNVYKTIVNSIKPNFSTAVEQKDIKTQKAIANDNTTHYELNSYSISLPNTMELRNKNSMMSLGKAIVTDKISNIIKVDIPDFNFVFQPVGSDDVQNIDRQKKALALYARVLINYQKGANNEFFKWNSNITYTKDEYNQLNSVFKEGLMLESEKMKKINMEIVNIDNIEIKKNANKFVYIKQQYERKGNNGNVKVIVYYLQNNNEMVKLTVSYRISESDLWEADFNKIIDSFNFKIKR